MMQEYRNRKGRLRGRSLLVYSEVPRDENHDSYSRTEDVHLEIEEAIISLARAVFAEDGCLEFYGDSSLSVILALVCGEYMYPRFAEMQHGDRESRKEMEDRSGSPLLIHPYRDIETYQEDMNLLSSLGYIASHRDEGKHHAFRRSETAAAVFVGGTRRTEEGYYSLQETNAKLPIYSIDATGGFASKIAREGEERHQENTKRAKAIDRDVTVRLRNLRSKIRTDETHKEEVLDEHGEKHVMPYSLIMQSIVDDIIGMNNQVEL